MPCQAGEEVMCWWGPGPGYPDRREWPRCLCLQRPIRKPHPESHTFARHDTIADFAHASDIIDIYIIDAVRGLPGNQAFHLTPNTHFTHHTGELVIRHGTQTRLLGDTAGDGIGNFCVTLSGAIPLTAGDLVL